jgi:hypothetical protein
MQNVVTLTKDAMEHKTIAHGAFLDLEAAFNRMYLLWFKHIKTKLKF